MIHIYFLLCPFTGHVRYVGKTKNPLAVRLSRHVTKARTFQTKNHCSNWIRSLLSQGAEPWIVSAEQLDDFEDWKIRETEMIVFVKTLGYDLTNSTSGGDGFHHIRPECITKRLQTKKKSYEESPGLWARHLRSMIEGRKTPEARKRRSEAALKAWSDPAKRESMTSGMQTTQAKRNRSEASKRRYQNPEQVRIHKQKMGRLFQNPENREQLRQASLKRWALYRERKTLEQK